MLNRLVYDSFRDKKKKKTAETSDKDLKHREWIINQNIVYPHRWVSVAGYI